MSTVRLEPVYLLSEPVKLNAASDLQSILMAAWSAPEGILLGQAFDGVLWGRIADGRRWLANDEMPKVGARLRAETLLNLRLFNPECELRVWRRSDRCRRQAG